MMPFYCVKLDFYFSKLIKRSFYYSAIMDQNPQPLDHESPTITTVVFNTLYGLELTTKSPPITTALYIYLFR